MKAVFKYWAVQAGAFTCDNFISLFGNPHFGAVSTKYEGGYYDKRPFTGFLIADYSRTYAKLYSFGIKGEVYYQKFDNMVYNQPLEIEKKSNLGISIGAYLRLNLDFLLKRY